MGVFGGRAAGEEIIIFCHHARSISTETPSFARSLGCECSTKLLRFLLQVSVATLGGNSDGQYSRIPYNPNDISFYEHKVNGKLVGKPAVSSGTGWTALSPNGIKYGHYGKRYQEKEWQRVMYECELLMYFGFIVLAIVWKIQGLFVVNKWNNIHPVPQGI